MLVCSLSCGKYPFCLPPSLGTQFLKDHATFDATAKYWTETFAKKASLQEKVRPTSLAQGSAPGPATLVL